MREQAAAPRVIAVEDAVELGVRAGDCLIELLRMKPRAVLTLPAGQTPLPLYRHLRALYAAGQFKPDFTYCALDEYCGLDRDDPRLLTSWVARECLDPLNIPTARRLSFRGDAADPNREACRVADELAAQGGLDIAVLGLGANGHIGFNEPGSIFDSEARAVELTAETRAANAAYWSGRTSPERAMTLGLGDLGRARHVLLLVSGANKAAAVKQAFGAKPTPAIPASCLQYAANVVLVADRAALAAWSG